MCHMMLLYYVCVLSALFASLCRHHPLSLSLSRLFLDHFSWAAFAFPPQHINEVFMEGQRMLEKAGTIGKLTILGLPPDTIYGLTAFIL